MARLPFKARCSPRRPQEDSNAVLKDNDTNIKFQRKPTGHSLAIQRQTAIAQAYGILSCLRAGALLFSRIARRSAGDRLQRSSKF
jgi:hypothetical protein